ncbi:MAG: hypothetical protein JNL01_14575 [Bdellovibrionales bacterium]|nr:hypothetical protein [Bdellovibrionales bacterium]
MKPTTIPIPFLLAAAAIFSQGCSTAQQREAQRKMDVVSEKFGFGCDFVKTDSAYDMEAELTNRMYERCDETRPFTVSPFVTATDIRGMIFCCSIDPNKYKKRATDLRAAWGAQSLPPAPEPKVEVKPVEEPQPTASAEPEPKPSPTPTPTETAEPKKKKKPAYESSGPAKPVTTVPTVQ